MNWGIVKRNQLHTRPAPSCGTCTIAEEAEIDYVFLRLQKLEETNRTVQKECKNLKECFLNLARTEQKLTADLSSCSQVYEEEEFRTLAEEYHSVSKQMGDCAKTFSDKVQVTVSDPLKKLANEFGSAQAAIKKRDQIVTEILPLKKQLDKLKEKERTGTNIAKIEQLKRSLSTMEHDFKATNQQLLTDMQNLLELRVDYIEPSLLAFIRAETDYYGECTTLFNSLVFNGHKNKDALTGTVRQEPLPGTELITQFNQDMAVIRRLSIVADKALVVCGNL